MKRFGAYSLFSSLHDARSRKSRLIKKPDPPGTPAVDPPERTTQQKKLYSAYKAAMQRHDRIARQAGKMPPKP